jgi:hypothetical protein
MIVKAYNDARVYATELHGNETPVINMDVITREAPDSTGQNGKALSIRTISARGHEKHAVNVRTRVQSRKSEPGRRVHPSQTPLGTQYQAVIRELRKTKTKLGQLESIHRQLTESQMSMQAQLTQLLNQMKEYNDTGNQTTKPASDTSPSMPNILS